MKRRLLGIGGIRFTRLLFIAVLLWVIYAFVVSVSDEPGLAKSSGRTRHRKPYRSKGQHRFNPANITRPSLYVDAILEPELITFDGLKCSKPLNQRYGSLKGPSSWRRPKPKYFFALDLHQSRGIIARLLGSILEAANYLGPEHCAISIVEGRSTDGTFDILFDVQQAAIDRGVDFYLAKNDDVDPKAPDVNRFETLAELRNQALRPLLKDPSRYDEDTTVVFSNDVSLCVNDILELIYQRKIQKADLACAMDYSNDGLFYDVWIARGMTGDIFFEIPPSGLWKYAKNLFWNDDKAKKRLITKKPFQVYACWNGIAAFTAKPLTQEGVKFQASGADECLMGEPTIFCRDFWTTGFGRIMVVPSVWVAYGNRAIEKIKRTEGYVEQHVLAGPQTDQETELIEWEPKPPPKVKCLIPSMADPTWVNSTTFAMPASRGEEFSEFSDEYSEEFSESYDNDGMTRAYPAAPTSSMSADGEKRTPVKTASRPGTTSLSDGSTRKSATPKDLRTESKT
ncbi:MAG: hypothetical protein Q9191_004116 [Dirinaria sp. TL-2023a]